MTLRKLLSLCLLAGALGLVSIQPATACWDPFGRSGGCETGGGTSGGGTGGSTGGASGSVPIPGTFALLAGGLAGLAWVRSRRS